MVGEPSGERSALELRAEVDQLAEDEAPRGAHAVERDARGDGERQAASEGRLVGLGAECSEPLAVRGGGGRVSACDRYYVARGYCVACNAAVGEIRAYPSTIFGIEEDERVLLGRARVY